MYLYKNILMVDDDPDDLFLFSRAVRQLSPDINITTTDNALHGLVTLKDIKGLDLILIDLNMPGMDGFQYLESLKREPQFRSIPCIIWTSSDSDGNRSKAMSLGASGFYIKSINGDKIRDMMKEILSTDLSVGSGD